MCVYTQKCTHTHALLCNTHSTSLEEYFLKLQLEIATDNSHVIKPKLELHVAVGAFIGI